MEKDENSKKVVFTTKMVDEITQRISDGEVIKRMYNPWFQNDVGVRRNGIAFKMTPEEIQEYIKCASDIHYFADNYCKIKLEDGSVGQMTLRDYQKDILDLYSENRFSILCSSRQIGKCFSMTTNVLVEVTSSDNSTKEIEIPLYKLLFKSKSNKTIYDYIKYFLYYLINLSILSEGRINN
jgi:hypothetical protein